MTAGTSGTIPVDLLKSCAGVDILKRMMAGELPPPPFTAFLDFSLESVDKGRVVFRAIPRYDHYNPIGSVHGGYITTLLDSCMGCAVHSMLDAGMGYTTLELKVNFVRRLTDKSGPVTAEGKIIHLGRSTGTAEAHLRDEVGQLYAHATTTCFVFPL